MTVLAEIARRAAADSSLWADSLAGGDVPESTFAGQCPDAYLLGVEMIREAYLLHRGESRLFRQDDPDLALLAGDYLYASGLVEICGTGDLRAVAALAELISQCAARRGDGVAESDDSLWEQTVSSLGAPVSR